MGTWCNRFAAIGLTTITAVVVACSQEKMPAEKVKGLATTIGAFAIPKPTPPADPGKLDAKGYIRQWLVLGPIRFGAGFDPSSIEKEQIPNEARLAPRAGDKQKVQSLEMVGGAPKVVDTELTWNKVVTNDYFVDFNTSLKLNVSDGCGGYAVAYLDAPTEMKNIIFSLCSNDSGRIYLNGKEIYTYVGDRGTEEDVDAVEGVTLNKGINVLIFKVWNGANNWQGNIRLLRPDDWPVTNVGVKLSK